MPKALIIRSGSEALDVWACIQWKQPELLFVFLQKLDTVKEAHLSYCSYVCWRSVCATRAKRYLSVRVSINVSIPKGFQINCSIDLCYIKTAVSETFTLVLIIMKTIRHSRCCNSHQKLNKQRSWRQWNHRHEAFKCLITLKCPMQISLLSVSKGISLAISGPKKLYMSAWSFIQG